MGRVKASHAELLSVVAKLRHRLAPGQPIGVQPLLTIPYPMPPTASSPRPSTGSPRTSTGGPRRAAAPQKQGGSSSTGELRDVPTCVKGGVQTSEQIVLGPLPADGPSKPPSPTPADETESATAPKDADQVQAAGRRAESQLALRPPTPPAVPGARPVQRARPHSARARVGATRGATFTPMAHFEAVTLQRAERLTAHLHK